MKQQSGFTLIELVVVIVLLGILASTAVPKFAAVTDQANKAVADGIKGAIYSTAAIQVAAANGAAVPFATIMDNLDCDAPAGTTVVTVTGGTVNSCTAANDNACSATGDTVTITVGTQVSTATLSGSLCDS